MKTLLLQADSMDKIREDVHSFLKSDMYSEVMAIKRTGENTVKIFYKENVVTQAVSGRFAGEKRTVNRR
ncbi:hypothetical protein [Lactobacillus kalixensis]|nr:hypothetical protein [Lactobacillus kalixensis]